MSGSADHDSRRHATVASLLRARAAEAPDAPALVVPGRECITYGRLAERVTGLACTLLQAAPPGTRMRTGLVLPNGAGLAVALLAAACAGVAVPFNPAGTAWELEDSFRRTALDVLLLAEGLDGPALQAARKAGIAVLRPADSAGISAAPPQAMPEPSPEDTAVVLYTSGSTGRPKGVPLTHRNICTSAADVCRSLELGPGDRCLCMWEQHHIGGLVDLLLAPLASGGSVICTGGFDAGLFFKLLAAQRPTWFQGVPATLGELVLMARRTGQATVPNALRFVRSVAAALPPRLMADLERLFGVPVVQTYGMSEAGPLITSTRLPPALRKPGSAGSSCGAEIRIAGPDGGDLGPGASGDILVRGDNVFRGYEGDPGDTAGVFLDGWFRTGDTGYLDADGDLFLTGRSRLTINRGGEKVNPQDVDDALLAHPDVAEAAAFGVPHATFGEDVAAAVALVPGAGTTEADLLDFLATRLAPFRMPQRILVVPKLPRTPIGKVDRPALGALHAGLAAPEHTPPRHGLDSFLTRLWAAELDAGKVGIDDNFSDLGGDSLARTRILLRVESALNLRIQDAEAAAWNTVRRMADAMAGKGGRGVGDLLARGGAEVVDTPDAADVPCPLPLRQAAGAMLACRGAREADALADAITATSTAGELRELLRILPEGGPLATGLSSLPAWWARTRWRSRLEADLRSMPPDPGWTRREISGDAFMYQTSTLPDRTKTLVVGFCGNAMRLMLPVYAILEHLDPDAVALLLVRDPERAHYARGVPGLGRSVDEVADALQAIAVQSGCRQVVGLGTSAGGLAAVCAALRNNWAGAMAVGADTPLRHAHILDCLAHPAARAAVGPRIRLHHAAANTRDSAAVREVARLVPSAETVPAKGFRHHNLLHHLRLQGRLTSFLRREIEEILAFREETDGAQTQRP